MSSLLSSLVSSSAHSSAEYSLCTVVSLANTHLSYTKKWSREERTKGRVASFLWDTFGTGPKFSLWRIHTYAHTDTHTYPA